MPIQESVETSHVVVSKKVVKFANTIKLQLVIKCKQNVARSMYIICTHIFLNHCFYTLAYYKNGSKYLIVIPIDFLAFSSIELNAKTTKQSSQNDHLQKCRFLTFYTDI